MDPSPVADVEELVLAGPESGDQGRASLRVLPTIEAVQLRRHAVQVIIRIPEKKIMLIILTKMHENNRKMKTEHFKFTAVHYS